MIEAIERIDGWLRANRKKFYDSLQPGLRYAQITELERKLDITVPTAFKDFYHWRNGEYRYAYTGHLLYGWEWTPLESVVENALDLRRMLEDGDFTRPNWWGRNWLPFMENGAGDHICLDLDGAFEGEPGQVIEFYHDYPSRNILLPSFSEWLGTVVSAMNSGIFADEQDEFDENYDNLLEYIHQKHADYPIRVEAG